MSDFKDLQVWQKSIDFVTEIYKATDTFPENEKFGLVAQLRRAAVSIPSNISEGSTRRSKVDFIQYLKIARGSAAEIETQLIIARKINFLSDESYNMLTETILEISKMLNGLIKSLSK